MPSRVLIAGALLAAGVQGSVVWADPEQALVDGLRTPEGLYAYDQPDLYNKTADEVRAVDGLLRDGKPAEALAAAERYLADHPLEDYELARVLFPLLDLVAGRGRGASAPDDLRNQAFELAARLMAGKAHSDWTYGAMLRYLFPTAPAARKSDLDAQLLEIVEQNQPDFSARYARAESLAASCRDNAAARRFLGQCLDQWKAAEPGNAAAAAARQRLIRRYRADDPGAAAEEAEWARRLGSPDFAALPATARYEALHSAMTLLPKGTAAGSALYQAVSAFRDLRRDRPAVSDDQLLDLLEGLANLECMGLYNFSSFVELDLVMPSLAPAAFPRACRIGARMAASMGMRDKEASYLYKLARAVWDFDRQEAIAALERLLAVYPAGVMAVNAQWFLAVLRDGHGVTQSPLARESRLAAFRANIAYPPLPPAPEVQSAALAADADGARKPEPCNVKEDMALHQPASALEDAQGAGLAVDGNARTAWTPTNLPAVLTVALKRETTVDGVVLDLSGPAYFSVRLLNRGGRTLARYERDWSFVDAANASWPPPLVMIEAAPVDGVCFVQVEIYRAQSPDIGLKRLEVTPAAYPARREHVLEPVAFAAGANPAALRVDWTAKPVEGRETVYRAGTDAVSGARLRGFINRWGKQWGGAGRPIALDADERADVEFFGSKAVLRLQGAGHAAWLIENENGQRITGGDIVSTNAAAFDQALAEGLPPGRKRLRVFGRPGIPVDDQFVPENVKFHSLKAGGLPRLEVWLRFAHDASAWDEWLGPLEPGAKVAVPVSASGHAPTRYQAKLVFDNRAVAGADTAVLASLAVTPDAGPATIPPAVARNGGASAPSGGFREELDEVARLVRERGVVVTYPRMGTPAVREAARAIAEKAGVYLVSDDHALNQIGESGYPGLPLAVGTPLDHRYGRQLIMSEGIWNDPVYLNNATGVVGLVRHNGRPWCLYATGETEAAVLAAARRLLDDLPAHRPSAKPFRVFDSDILEMVYAWQLHPDRPRPERLRLRMARGDRRSLQFGIAAEHELKDLHFEATPLRDVGGRELAARIQVRPVGFYEWIPFFGDLRLPNQLLDAPRLPVPANTAFGVWVTAATDTNAAPGTYRGTLRVASGGRVEDFPLEIEVPPLRLPESRVRHYSFLSLEGVWFNPGSPLHEKAMRAIAENEAETGINMIPCAELGWSPTPGGRWPFVLDFRAFDHRLDVYEAAYRERGLLLPWILMSNSHVQNPALLPAAVPDGASPEDRRAAIDKAVAEQLREHLEKTGRWDRANVIRVADEPADLGVWATWARPFRAAGFRTTVCGGRFYEKAAGTLDPWCPNFAHFGLAGLFAERRKQGEDIWWYMCGDPPTRITGLPVVNLPFYWQTAKWRMTGALSYAALGNVSTHYPMPFRYEHGMDHRVLLLPDGSLLDTTRRMLESEGIHDCRLLELVQDGIERLRASGETARAEAAADELRQIFFSVVPYKYNYARDPAAWTKARNAAYDLALRIGEGTRGAP